MAFEKTNKRTFNPANITVNRGDSIASYGKQVTQQQFQLTDTFQNVIANEVDQYKSRQKIEGKKLALETEIVYEDQEITNENGETSTHRVPVRYNRPEESIKTSWAANVYDEQIEEQYTNALVTSGNELILDLKLQSKQTTDYDASVSDVTTLFRNNAAAYVDALRETVPQAYINNFDTKMSQLVASAATELGNKHIVKREAYIQGQSKHSRDSLKIEFATSFLNNDSLESKIKLLDEEYANQLNAANTGDDDAKLWMDNEYQAMKSVVTMTSKFGDYFNVDYSDPSSIARGIKNINAMQVALVSGGSVNLVGPKGEFGEQTQDLLSLQDLGFDAENMPYKKEVLSVINTSKILMNERYDAKQANVESINYFKENNRSTLGVVGILDKSDKEKISIAIETPGTAELDYLVPIFLGIQNAENNRRGLPAISTLFNSDTINDPQFAATKEKFYNYLAGNHQIVKSSAGKNLLKKLRAVQRATESGLLQENRDIIEEVFADPNFLLVQNLLVKDKNNTYKSISVLDNIPGFETEDIALFKRFNDTLSSSYSTNEASNKMVNQEIINNDLKLENKTLFAYAGLKGLLEFDSIISDEIKNQFSSVNFGPDNIVSQHFRDMVQRQVLLNIKMRPEAQYEGGVGEDLIQSETMYVINRLTKTSGWGADEYLSGFAGTTNDSGEVNYQDAKTLGRWGPSKYLSTTKKERPLPSYQGKPLKLTNEAELDAYDLETIQIEKNGGMRGKTEAWRLTNNLINEAVGQDELSAVHNPQFKIGTKLVLGENIKLVSSPRVNDENSVNYQVVFYASPTSPPMYLKDKKGMGIRIPRKQIKFFAKNNKTIETKVTDELTTGEALFLARQKSRDGRYEQKKALNPKFKKRQEELIEYRKNRKAEDDFQIEQEAKRIADGNRK